jgi:hypothetical protein
MKPAFTSLSQISKLTTKMISDTGTPPSHERMASSWLDTALWFLARKQIDYAGDEYLDQIDRSAIYLREDAPVFMATIAEFLCKGTLSLKKRQIPSFLTDLRQDVLKATQWQLDFVRSGCDGCPVHYSHQFWSHWRRVRRKEPAEDYLKGVEFGCIYHQMIFNVSEACLDTLLRKRAYGGSASELPMDKVFVAIDKEIRHQVCQRSGLMAAGSQRAGG